MAAAVWNERDIFTIIQLSVKSVPISDELEYGSWRGVLDTTLCDQVCQ